MMHWSIPLALAGSLAGGASPAAVADAAPSPGVPVVQSAQAQSFAELEAAYKAALEHWEKAIRAAEDGDARRALRKQHPANEFYPLFKQALGRGEQMAAVWMIVNARRTELSRDEAGQAAVELYTLLLQSEQIELAVLEAVCPQLLRDRRALGEERALALLTGAFERLESRECKGLLALTLGHFFERTSTPEAAASVLDWFERAASDFGDTPHGIEAGDIVFERKHLAVGAVAPDFGGQSIDGEEIKLGDTRGKIVVLDFFGFW